MSPSSSHSSSRVAPFLTLTLGAVALAAGIWWFTRDTGPAPVVPDSGPEQEAPSSEGPAGVALPTQEPGKAGAKDLDGQVPQNPPRAGSGDPILAAQEKRLTDVIHEPSSQPGAIITAMEALLRDKRLQDAGMSEMIELLPHAARDKELALGLLALAKKYPHEPMGTSLIRVFDETRDVDVRLAAVRAMEAHRRFGFSDAELMRMRRDSSDSMVHDEIDRILRKGKR